MNIIFEDKSIVVCIKNEGILSQSDSGGGESMVSLLEEHTGGTVYPVHRLDKGVGGIMVYAKNKTAAADLSRDIAEHCFKKEYIALLHGCPDTPYGELRDLLFKDSTKNKSFVVKRQRRGVKEALLEYKILKSFFIGNEQYSFVEILLHTGRTHQIRVQFSSRKMPLVGDKKYGASDEFKNIGLWSYRLTFRHPISGEEMRFTAEPQNFMADYL